MRTPSFEVCMTYLFRGLWSVLAVSFVISITSCAGESSSPTAPSNTPAPSPAPAPAPSPSPSPSPQPSPAFGLSAISLSQSDVESQAQPLATVFLTSLAPVGGIDVALSSSDTIAARIPTSVTVAAGTSSATFTIITNTVTASTRVTITASYAGVTRTATLTVLPPTLTAVFTVRSPAKGADSCLLGPSSGDIDCDTDGRSSRGLNVERYHWSYFTGPLPLGHTTTDGLSKPRLTNGCAFFEGARGGDNADGSKYVQMTIELVVEDRSGARSGPTRRAIKLYPSGLCGFSY